MYYRIIIVTVYNNTIPYIHPTASRVPHSPPVHSIYYLCQQWYTDWGVPIYIIEITLPYYHCYMYNIYLYIHSIILYIPPVMYTLYYIIILVTHSCILYMDTPLRIIILVTSGYSGYSICIIILLHHIQGIYTPIYTIQMQELDDNYTLS